MARSVALTVAHIILLVCRRRINGWGIVVLPGNRGFLVAILPSKPASAIIRAKACMSSTARVDVATGIVSTIQNLKTTGPVEADGSREKVRLT